MVTNKGKIWMCRVWPFTWLCHEDGYEPGVDWHGSPIYLQAWQEVLPTNAPSIASSDAPSLFPSNKPSLSPSIPPSYVPSESPSIVPSESPSESPSTVPSDKPSLSPSDQPSVSVSPSTVPSASPSQKPSTSFMPSQLPSMVPSNKPSLSISPSNVPSMSLAPTLTPRPTNAPFVLVCPQAAGATQLGEHLEGVVYDGEFGDKVALSDDGKTVAVYSEMTGTTNDYIGRVQVYRFENGIWEQIGQTFEGGSRDRLGHGLSISADGSIIAISTYQDADATSSYANVYEYDAAADSWVQMGNPINDRNCLDWFGFSNSLSADGTILAIGVPNYSDLLCRTGRYSSSRRSGAVKVYQYTTSTNTWAQLGDTLLAENSLRDFFGYSVSLSNDGFILAVGAYLNDGANGVESGHVRVFQYDGTNWVQNGADIDGENAEDWSGHQVSLSSDGSRVAISAKTNSGPNRVSSAQARVYESDSSQSPWTTYSQVGNDMDLGNRDNGSAVSLSGDGTTVALSAARAYTQNWNGIVRLYKDDGSGNWAQTIDLVGSGDFGDTVSLSSDGSILAVGQPMERDRGQIIRKAGRVCMYQLD